MANALAIGTELHQNAEKSVNEITLKAIDASIIKWKKVVNKTWKYSTNPGCPLCYLFTDCIGCPIVEMTGEIGCRNTIFYATSVCDFCICKTVIEGVPGADNLMLSTLYEVRLDFIKRMVKERN